MRPRTYLVAVAVAVALGLLAELGWAQGGPGIGVPSGPSSGGKLPADFDTLQSGVTASTTHTQTGATQLTGTIANITTATTSDAVKLLLCTHPPMRQDVVNTTSATIQVYASGTDTINGTAGSTGVSQSGPGKTGYLCTAASPGGTWFK